MSLQNEQQPADAVEQKQPPEAEHQTGYTGHEYPWMTDPKAYKADHSLRHIPPMLRRPKGGKAR